jgi:hypothetical protein
MLLTDYTVATRSCNVLTPQVGYGLFLQSLTAAAQVSAAPSDVTAATTNTTDDNTTAADVRALAELQQWGKQCMMAAAHAAEHSDESAL